MKGFCTMKKLVYIDNNTAAHIVKNRITVFNVSDMSILFTVVLSVSNRKIGKITNFSVMPGEMCAEHCMETCYKKCYDMNAVNFRHNVRAAREANTYAVKNHLELFGVVMDMYLSKYRPELFRIHVGGDFKTYEYFEQWIALSSHTETTFLAYTKCYDVIRYAFTYKGITVPDNMSLYISLWNGITFPYDLMAILPTATLFEDDCHKDPNATICPGSCQNCKMCYEGKPVVFIPHGNGISAKRHEQLKTAASLLFKTYNA